MRTERRSGSVFAPKSGIQRRPGGLAHGLQCMSAEAVQFHMYASQLHESAASRQVSLQADQTTEAPTAKHEAASSGGFAKKAVTLWRLMY